MSSDAEEMVPAGGELTLFEAVGLEVVPFAVELRGGDPVISERLRA